MDHGGEDKPLARRAAEVQPRTKASNYPEPFLPRVAGREKRVLGDLFGLCNFGVNLTTLQPGAESALMHHHSRQDEFVYILSGTVTLFTDRGETEMGPGMCAGFAAGTGIAHHLVNRGNTPVTYLEIGDRTPGDEGIFPADDIKALLGADGRWQFAHKDGSAW